MTDAIGNIFLRIAGALGLFKGRAKGSVRVKDVPKSKRSQVISSPNGVVPHVPLGPEVHTTRMGSQYVNARDVVASEAGQKAIQELKDAGLIGRAKK
jgi:hypothetical protein